MKDLFVLLTFFPFLLTAQTDTLSIYFEIDSYSPSSQELKKLKWDSTWSKVNIIAYADYLGSDAHNQQLTTDRANKIKSVLIEQGLPEKRIENVEAKGEIGKTQSSSLGEPKNRRVDVLIFNEVAQVTKIKASTIKDSTTNQNSGKKQELSKQIETATIGSNLILNDLLFVGGQQYITHESRPTLDSLIAIMKANKNLKIAIEGHICCETTQPDGQDFATGKYNLSEARAYYIYNRLIVQGIDSNRLSYKGFARTRPIYKVERNEYEQQANRRVEIRIVEK